MQIKADEISAIIKEKIKGFDKQVDDGAANMNSQARKVRRISVKRDLDLPLQRLAQPPLDAVLFCWGQRRSRRYRDLLRSFRLIDQFGKRLCNIGEEPDSVLLDQLSKEGFAGRRTTETLAKLCEDDDLLLDTEYRRGNDMPESRRLFHGLA